MKKHSEKPEISLVIPILNEADNILELASLIDEAFVSIPFEVLWVDDNSKDNTRAILKELNEKNPAHRYISLMRTSGQSTALMAGIDAAKGNYIATLDGDIQNFPEDIAKMYPLVKSGEYDMMVGWRQERWQESKFRRLPSLIANWVIRKAFKTSHLHDAGCSVKIASSQVFKNIRLYGELHRFIAYIAHDLGAKIGELVVRYAPRKHGVSKYGLSRTFKVIVDIVNLKMLMMRKTTPTQMVAPLVISSLGISFLSAFATLFMKLFQQADITGNPLFVTSIITFFMGMQFLFFGFLGEMMLRAYYESGEKKNYVIRAQSTK